MRYPLFSLLLFVASASPAAQAWRWVDQNGVVHYSDQPHPGAQPVQVKPAPKPGSVVSGYEPSSPDSQTARSAARVAAVTQCRITAPQSDDTFDNPEAVSMLIQVQPSLPPELSVQATLNGEPLLWPPRSFAYQWAEPARGADVTRTAMGASASPVSLSSTRTTATLSRAMVNASALARGTWSAATTARVTVAVADARNV